MNRIFFEAGEVSGNMVTFADFRAEHILNVLHGEVGQTLKTGIVNGLIGTSVITAINGAAVTIKCDHNLESQRPWVDLVLAPPRPRALKRLLPQLASLGVGRIILVGARKVEKDFWGATLLKEENYRPLLIEGLMQSGTSALPTLEPIKAFRKWVGGGGLDELASGGDYARKFIAHPGAEGIGVDSGMSGSRTLLAVGPEGGWTDDEVKTFEERGFARYSLGNRILRTDTALIALLARLM